MKLLAVTFAIAALPAAALACTAPEPVSERFPDLFATLATAQDEGTARVTEDAIWREWVMAPDGHAQDLLDDGMRRIRQSDLDGAEAALSDLTVYCPDYAEGWSQRAYARFLQQRYDEALADIREALAREPRHFGALSGRLRILYTQGRIGLARRALTDAIEINPFLRERFLLPLDPLDTKT